MAPAINHEDDRAACVFRDAEARRRFALIIGENEEIAARITMKMPGRVNGSQPFCLRIEPASDQCIRHRLERVEAPPLKVHDSDKADVWIAIVSPRHAIREGAGIALRRAINHGQQRHVPIES